MALGIYKKVDDTYVAITSDAVSTIYTVHDGKAGTTSVLQLYLRNDSATNWYKNITILPEDTNNSGSYDDVTFYETGWGIKLAEGSSQPTSAEWSDINWGETIRMNNIGSDDSADTTTYYPFWYLISSPPNLNAQNKTDIILRVRYTESTVL